MDSPETLRRHTDMIEEGLRSLFLQRSFPLYRLMEYQLGWSGETGEPLDFPQPAFRLHASLCLMACESLGDNPSSAIPAATAVELVHQFTQIHADIQEGNQTRYNRPAVWWIWGPAQAINAGDGLHALARLSLIRPHSDAPSEHTIKLLQTLDSACLRMCEGMYLDMEYQERIDIFPESYLRMAKEKMGALLGCALEMGAIAADAGEPISTALRHFGEDMGVALQIQEDIQSLWGEPLSGKVAGIDVLNKKKGYPVILALAEAPISQKRALGTLFFKRVLESPDIAQVRSILEGLGAREKAQQAIQRTFDQAMAHLTSVSLTGFEDLVSACKGLALRE